MSKNKTKKEKFQYLYFSEIDYKWHITDRFYKHKPKFKSIVPYIEKFIPPEIKKQKNNN